MVSLREAVPTIYSTASSRSFYSLPTYLTQDYIIRRAYEARRASFFQVGRLVLLSVHSAWPVAIFVVADFKVLAANLVSRSRKSRSR